MKKTKMIILACCIGLCGYAGDTNFVNAFNSIWKTHNASNILIFVEQNVTTNKSPETLFARGIIAVALQEWTLGASNYWEQAIQILTTNDTYSAMGKTNAIKEIRGFQMLYSGLSDSPPRWETNTHSVIFMHSGNEVPFLDELKEISTIPPTAN